MRKYRHRDLGLVAASTMICSYLWGPAWLSWGWLQHLGVQCWCPVQGCWLLVRWVVDSAKSEVFSVKMDGGNLLPMIGNLSSYSSILVFNSPIKWKYICRWDCVLSPLPPTHTTASCPKLNTLSKYFLNLCARISVSVQPELNSLSFILDSILWF